MPNQPRSPRVLITAGPTHEPVDAVRYLANRSSGSVGLALADQAALRGLETRLLLGPVHARPMDSGVETIGFRTTADLEKLLAVHGVWADLIIMAAAVADFRPAVPAGAETTKLRRSESGMTLDLEPTPDLLAQLANRRRPGQILVGFALEPQERLESSSRDKLVRKGIDFIVANPLETMDSPQISATLLARDEAFAPVQTPGKVSKPAFAEWLLDQLQPFICKSRHHD